MRSLVVMAMFASSLTHAVWNGYTETRDLELATDGIDILEIDAGAGSIVVTGAADASSITAWRFSSMTAAVPCVSRMYAVPFTKATNPVTL